MYGVPFVRGANVLVSLISPNATQGAKLLIFVYLNTYYA